ncbi:MAG: hypothetical protein FJ291_00055 [Planctomycetes bacterium]|nr:hypothetical protein [Planctomycetota bacterium]
MVKTIASQSGVLAIAVSGTARIRSGNLYDLFFQEVQTMDSCPSLADWGMPRELLAAERPARQEQAAPYPCHLYALNGGRPVSRRSGKGEALFHYAFALVGDEACPRIQECADRIAGGLNLVADDLPGVHYSSQELPRLIRQYQVRRGTRSSEQERQPSP